MAFPGGPIPGAADRSCRFRRLARPGRPQGTRPVRGYRGRQKRARRRRPVDLAALAVRLDIYIRRREAGAASMMRTDRLRPATRGRARTRPGSWRPSCQHVGWPATALLLVAGARQRAMSKLATRRRRYRGLPG